MRSILLAYAAILSLIAPPTRPVSPSASQLVEKASEYVERFVREFSSVVAEERYVQDVRTAGSLSSSSDGGLRPTHVELRSDCLFISTSGSDRWLAFRDVYSVNGRPVRDREQRLAKLFLDPSADSLEQATTISREGYRYNLGSRDRTIANPFAALGFLQRDYRARFDFSVAGADDGLGSDVWIVAFKERGRPTILRTADNRDVTARGRLWIDARSGRVLQTELDTNTGDRVLTVFSYDETLQLDVPSEMRDLTWFERTPITGIATYSHFRRFTVHTDQMFR
jgi:hypothetical protein